VAAGAVITHVGAGTVSEWTVTVTPPATTRSVTVVLVKGE
jgi:hypothetical protein